MKKTRERAQGGGYERNEEAEFKDEGIAMCRNVTYRPRNGLPWFTTSSISTT